MSDTVNASAPRLTEEIRPLLRPGADPATTLAWLRALEKLAVELDAPLTEVRRAVSDLSWDDRALGNRVHPVSELVAASEEPPGELLRLMLDYQVALRHRFDFRFARILEEVDAQSRFPDDALLQSIQAFAALGARHPSGRQRFEEVYQNPRLDSTCRDVLLHGLWFATNLEDQGDLILAVSDDMLARGETGENVFFRRAYAFRIRGEFDRAHAAIARAIDMLGPGHNDIHQDYAREAEQIRTAESLDRRIQRSIEVSLKTALDSIEARASRAEESVSRSLLGVVEVLGLFIALIGFLGLGVVALFQEMAFERQLLLLLLLLGGSVGFFLLLRLVTGIHRTRRERARGRGQRRGWSRGSVGTPVGPAARD